MCTLIDTDARAVEGRKPPLFAIVVGEVCLGIYTLELVAGWFVEGCQYFKKKSVLFDLFTVLGSISSRPSFVSACDPRVALDGPYRISFF